MDNAASFRWSSYAAYLGKVKTPEWLVQGEIRNFFDDKHFSQQYRLFVEKGNEKEFEDQFEKAKATPILGCDAFIHEITRKYLKPHHCITDIPEHKIVVTLPRIQEIITAVTDHYDISRSAVLIRNRRGDNVPRAMAIYLSRHLGQLSSSDIAIYFQGISASGVSKSCERLEIELKMNTKLASDFGKLSSTLLS